MPPNLTAVLLVFFKQGRTCHSNKTCIGKRLLHLNVEGSMLGTVPLIHQDKNIVTFKRFPDLFNSGSKLIDDSSDHRIAFAFKQFNKPLAGSSILHKHPAFTKGLGYLVIQVCAVSYTILGLRIDFSRAIACASITMVNDFPLPGYAR